MNEQCLPVVGYEGRFDIRRRKQPLSTAAALCHAVHGGHLCEEFSGHVGQHICGKPMCAVAWSDP